MAQYPSGKLIVAKLFRKLCCEVSLLLSQQPALGHILSQLNLSHTNTPCFFKIQERHQKVQVFAFRIKLNNVIRW
jgi:hypothetical protein